MNTDPKITCIICSGQTRAFFEKDGYPHLLCSVCGLVFVHPQPTNSFLAEEVYSEKSGYQANKPKDLRNTIATIKQKKFLDYIKGNSRGGKSLLDVGCSSGELMFLAQKVGFTVTGVELNSRTANIARDNGLDVRVNTLEGEHFTESSFDYIHMGDLIEHVSDPRTLILESRRLLKTGGALAIVTPNMDCFWSKTTLLLWKLFRIPWSSATPPHHLYEFSFGNLKRLLMDNGFTVKTTWYTGTPTLKYELGSLHLLGRWKKNRSLGNLMLMLSGFSLYSIIFGINRLVEFFPVKQFSMTMIAIKNHVNV